MAAATRRTVIRIAMLPIVLAFLWAVYEGYRWLWQREGWSRPVRVNDYTMPHLVDVVGQLGVRTHEGGPYLGVLLWHAALFTAKEAALGFAFGALVGFALGVLLSEFAILRKGILPYIVASQTIPLIAIAPIVVVGLGNLRIGGWTPDPWLRVAVISAYLTFFPVTVNTIRGLLSADPWALELMHSYAASRWTVLWKVRVPSALPYLFAAFKVAATACVVGAIIGEAPSSIQNGLGGQIVFFNQYYSLTPENLWATNVVAALLGISFFLIVVITERLVVRRAPEHLT